MLFNVSTGVNEFIQFYDCTADNKAVYKMVSRRTGKTVEFDTVITKYVKDIK